MESVKPSPDTCLGLVEIASVPTGLVALDAMVKEAVVRVLAARPVTPARYVVFIEGEVEAVTRSVERGLTVAGSRGVGRLLLPQPHPQLRDGLQGLRRVDLVDALGVVQTATLAAGLVAADGALKTGAVELIELRLAMGLGGHAFFTVTGEVSSVEAALERATQLATTAGGLIDAAVIPRPDPDVVPHLLDPTAPFSDLRLI